MEGCILLTTGFIVPNNNYFTLIRREEDNIKRLFNRNSSTVISDSLIKFFRDNDVYTSNTINNAYYEYTSNKNFNNFIKLLDIAIDILKDTSFVEFIKLQVTNKHLTNISLQFCMDLYNGNFINTYRSYFVVPSNVRFTVNNNLTKYDILNKLNKIDNGIEKFIGFNKKTNWLNVFTELMENKQAFESFFKYIFVDIELS